MSDKENLIIGGGVTGLAAGYVSSMKVYEAEQVPGGICSSYYLRPGEERPIYESPEDKEAYRFEIGGGHWIFGGSENVLSFIENLTPVKRYYRKSSVYFPDRELYVPYPIQNNLRYLGKDIANKAVKEMENATDAIPATMEEWLEKSFGRTLLDLFFAPFHELYTAGLWTKIAPQDAYKSPVDMNTVKNGAYGEQTDKVGYNVSYLYPTLGLNTLSGIMAGKCDIDYNKKVVEINTGKNEIVFSDGSGNRYNKLISTLPLNKALEFSGVEIDEPTDDYTSVLVLNIGAKKGSLCPDDHWLYVPKSRSRFHRVGFYSNVDSSFLPLSSRKNLDRVSIYVERAYPNGKKPQEAQLERYIKEVVDELKEWKFIEDAETVHPTWIEVAYTWAKPGSRWKETSIYELEKKEIIQVGRYGRWNFQGIAESINDGFECGNKYEKS